LKKIDEKTYNLVFQISVKKNEINKQIQKRPKKNKKKIVHLIIDLEKKI